MVFSWFWRHLGSGGWLGWLGWIWGLAELAGMDLGGWELGFDDFLTFCMVLSCFGWFGRAFLGVSELSGAGLGPF